MIKGSLSVDDMRLIVALGDIFEEAQGRPLSLIEISQQLKSRGFAVGNGMTREINDLEAKIGGRANCGKILLNRHKKGSTLTRAGRDIVQQMRKVLQTLGEVQTTVDSGRSVVRVGLTNSLATTMFPRVLRESPFLKSFPGVDLEIVEGEPHELVGLLQTQVDFAVGPREVNNGFPSRPLCEWKRVLLYSRNVAYQNDFSLPVSIATLREWLRHEVLLLPAPRIIPSVDKFLKPMLTGRRIVVPQAALRRLWVERGIGLAISYEEKRGTIALNNDPIRSIDLSSELGTTEMHLYQRQDQKLSAAATALMDGVFSIFSREQQDGLFRSAM
jgi:DNA-binding transcriptional LysR family regulator